MFTRIASLLVSLVSQVPEETGRYDLLGHVRPEDCVGATCDISPALDRISASFQEISYDPAFPDRGPVVLYPRTSKSLKLRQSRPLEVCSGWVLQGSESWHWGVQTMIDTSSSAVVAHPFERCMREGRGRHAAVTIVGIGFRGPAKTHVNMGGSKVVGIKSESYPTLIGTWIRNYVVGIEITGDVTREEGSNSSNWFVERARIDVCQHAGLLVRGGDSSVGLGLQISSASNCARAQDWNASLGPCGNVIERSFLGSTLIAAHTAQATDFSVIPNAAYPGFRFEGASQRSVGIGLYTEMDQQPSLLSPNSINVGGMSGWQATGTSGQYLFGRRSNGLIIENALDPANAVNVTMGTATNQGGVHVMYGHAGAGSAWPLRLKWMPALLGGSYLEDIGNSNNGWVRAIDGVHTGSSLELGRTTYYDPVLAQCQSTVPMCLP